MSDTSHPAWTSCFDQSAASTAAYVKAIYGTTATAATVQAFNWSAVQVIFPQFLNCPGTAHHNLTSIMACLLRHDGVYKRTMMFALWVEHSPTGPKGVPARQETQR